MRVYTTSPLYNYVELIFRTRKLFILCIVISTMAVGVVVMARPKFYTATAILQIYDDAVSDNTNEGQAARNGSVKAKLNLLQIHLKDHDFFKRSFEAAALDKDRSDVELEKLIRDAQNSVSFSANDSFLELSCKWPTQFCVNIINAIVAEYTTSVVTMGSRRNVAVLNQMQSQVEVFTKLAVDSEAALNKFQKVYIDKGIPDPNMISADLSASEKEVLARKNQLDVIHAEIQALETTMSQTDEYVEFDNTIDIASPIEGPEYRQLEAEKTRLGLNLDELKQRYTDNDPRVKKIADQIKDIQTKMTVIEKQKPDPKLQRRKVSKQRNPAYTMIKNQLISAKTRLSSEEIQLQNAEKRVLASKRQVPIIPVYRSQFSELSTKQAIYRTMRDNLKTAFERMKVDYESDLEKIKQGIRLVVAPTAEMDSGGKKQMIMMIAGPLLGIIIAFAFSLLTETLDHSLRTPAEVERYLGKPVLAVLPNMRPAKKVTELIRIAAKGEWEEPSTAIPPRSTRRRGA